MYWWNFVDLGAKMGDNLRESERAVAETTVAPDQTTFEEVDMATPKSKRSPAFQFYPESWLSSSKVSRMSHTERGMYIDLLAHCWLDGSLPADVKKLAATIKVPAQRFERIWKGGALWECFYERNGRLYNSRLDTERRKQVEHRKQKQDAAKVRWGSERNADALQSESPPAMQTQSSLHSVSVSASVSGSTHRQGGAPIHDRSHKGHAACGRVCVPADLHGKFVRARNHDGADKELRDWYLAVDREWSDGSRRAESTGANDYAFWRARFEEQWPAQVPVATKKPWAPLRVS